MTKALSVLLLLTSAWADVQITYPAQSSPLTPGATVQLSANVPVIWSLASGSQGSISPTGVYRAPDRTVPKQSFAGCQVLPNNHIFNTRIDDLPVHPKSDIWITSSLLGMGGTGIKYGPAFPVNFIDDQVQPKQVNFLYTPQNDGLFRLPSFPDLRVESGYWTWDLAGHDRHVIVVEQKTCTVQELYNLYPAGFVNACPKCTSQSGVKYGTLDVALPPFGTDAAGMQLLPLSFRLDELRAGVVNHALRFTIVRPDDRWLWPATTSAYYGHSESNMPMGARVRLKSTFDINSLSNPIAKVLATQLRQYGLILADAGLNWDVQGLLEKYPEDVRAAFAEVRGKINATHMEVVDQSQLMLAPNSGATSRDATVVIATNIINPADTARLEIKTAGVVVGTSTPLELIQAGADWKQLNASVSNTADQRVTWRMSPELGVLSPSGTYKPPAVVDTAVTTTVTATSVADPSAYTTIQVTILPRGVIRINAGDSSDYVDKQGNTWWGDAVDRRPAMGFNDGSYPYDFNGMVWKNTDDPGLFNWGRASLNDIIFKMTVPNGRYTITLKLAENGTEANLRRMHLETQGQVVHSDFDIFAAAGGSKTAIDVTLPALVSDGNLYVAMRQRGKSPSVVDACCSTPLYSGGWGPLVSAIRIAPEIVTQPPSVLVTPAFGGSLAPSQTRVFQAVVSGTTNTNVTWSLSPQVGSISAGGTYTAPASIASTQTVTVTATSVVDPAAKAVATVTLTPPIPAQAPAFTPIRAKAGANYTDALGQLWRDQGGVNFAPTAFANAAITGTNTPALYQAVRYAPNLQYRFPVPNGTYSVTLKFAEIYFTTAGRRIANISINGNTVLTGFDILAQAGGPNIAVDRSFTVNVTGGQIDLSFVAIRDNAMVNAIEIISVLPSSPPPPAFNPIRINAGGPRYTDPQGNLWSDFGYNHYGVSSTSAAIAGTTTPALYQTVRYGPDVRYDFVVPNGTYTLTLKFAEIYFTSVAKRIANVTINGTPVLTNFDIVAAAGGPNIAVDRIFPVVVTNGRINLAFTAVRDNAMVNAILITSP